MYADHTIDFVCKNRVRKINTLDGPQLAWNDFPVLMRTEVATIEGQGDEYTNTTIEPYEAENLAATVCESFSQQPS